MRKIYLLLAVLTCSTFLLAQTTPSVNFSFTIRPGTTEVNFANTSQGLGDGEKKAIWMFGDNTTATTGGYQGAVHRYASPGTYHVCLKVYKNATSTSNGTLIGEKCKEVVIQHHQQVCEAGFQWGPDGSPASKTIKFFGFGHSNPNKPIKRVCWDFGDGTKACETTSSTIPPSALLNVHHSYAQPGTYQVSIRIEFDGGCVAEKSKPITVAAPPTAACEAKFEVMPIVATPLGRKFMVQPGHSQQKMPVSICWKFGDGTADVCKPYANDYTGAYVAEHVYTQYRQYEVCVTVKYEDGCEKKKCHTVAVNPPPPPPSVCTATVKEVPVSATSGNERKFVVELMPNKMAKKIHWTFGNGKSQLVNLANPVTPQQLTTVHRYTAPGLYTVCARVFYDGGCVVEHCVKTIIGGNVHSSLVLSPNPVVNMMTAVFQSSRQQRVSVRIFNSFGIMVWQEAKNAVTGTNTWSINAGIFPTGAYSMVVQSPNQFATAIFFKQ